MASNDQYPIVVLVSRREIEIAAQAWDEGLHAGLEAGVRQPADNPYRAGGK